MCCFTLDVWGRQHRSRKLRALLFWECLKDSGNRGNLKSIVFFMGCLFVRDDVLFGLLSRSSASVEVRRRKGESKPQIKVLSKVWLMRLYVTNNDSLSFFSGGRIFCVFTADLNRDFRSRATEKRFKNSKRQTGTDTFGNLFLLKISKPEIRSEKNVSVVQCETDSKPETTVVLHMRTVNVV